MVAVATAPFAGLSFGYAAVRPRRPKAGAVQSAKALSAQELDILFSQVGAEDEGVAMAAVKRLADSNAPNASGPLLQLLAVGTTPQMASEALTALQKLKDPASVPVLVRYTGNRNLPARLQAVRALAGIQDDRVAATLIERLGDSATEVRTAAAEGLAARKERRATPRLMALVSRNDAGAAAPLGALLAPEDVPKVAEFYGRVENPILAAVWGEFLKRTEIADRLRLDVVRTLGRIPGAVATTALVEYLATVPENDNRPSTEEAQKLVDQRGKQ